MIMRDAAYRILSWLLVRVTALQRTMDCRGYGRHVYGGPAPVDWRVREGLPPNDQWPTSADGKTSLLVVGDVRCGRVRPVRAETFPTIGGNLPSEGESSVVK